jgi:hypothetical protein
MLKTTSRLFLTETEGERKKGGKKGRGNKWRVDGRK